MDPLAPGHPASVGPYRLLGRLGAGGMGVVFLGRSPNGRTAAVKLVHAELAADPEFRRRFRQEVGAAQRVSGQWTAPVLDSDTESAVPWVATGYVPGPSLTHVVEGLYGALPEESVWSLTDGLARALIDIHGNGLIHRDLKPSNVLVTLEGPKVIDFGIARAVDASLATRTGSMVGSPGYMPPEQIRSEQLTGAADVFAFGAVLVFAATGTGPFHAGEPAVHTLLYRVVHEEPELGPESGPLSGPLRELAERCLAKDPAQRPAVEEILRLTAGRAAVDADSGLWLPATLTARLGRDAAGLLALEGPSPTAFDQPALPPPAAPTTAPPAAPPAARKRRGLGLGAAAVAAVVAVTAVVVATRSSGDEEPRAGNEQNGQNGQEQNGQEQNGNEPQEQPQEEPQEQENDAPLHDLLPADIRESGEIEVLTGVNSPPLLFRDEADDFAGVEHELADALGEQLGVEFHFQQVDYGSLLQYLATQGAAGQSGTVGMGALPDTAESRDGLYLDFVNHYRDGWVLMVPAEDAARVDAPGDLCGGTVATYDFDEPKEIVGRYSGGCAEPIEFSGRADVTEMADAVRGGDADAVFVSYSTASGFLADGRHDDLAITGEQIDVQPYGIALPQADEGLRDALTEALQSLIDDGTYGEILQEWNVPDVAVDSATVNTGD
ncbi:serine/threonine-protein kinase [Streptomyces sp. MP131-18]|uniref:serine/threonine-protein kinase n=1 Tax=Streptomyces sp. MP131-18 TaxID=1857892 RepID=UPI00097C95B3|nr:serine/threonine-protein kinase [Streptomyces sp. MP131-18]ONK15109.1 Serine/threonine-protein kinase AfsK [Streptomyces sp. MP131-18]